MKIVDAEIFAIRIPLKHPFTIALGTLTHSNHVLVRMSDDDNRVGWGESTQTSHRKDPNVLAFQ